jgi:hypothetical protein
MYLRYLTTAVLEALKTTFDVEYPNVKFRDINISLEYPVKQQNYPGIWVGYEDASPLSIAGIAHREIDPEGHPYTRWKFAGHVTYTVVAFTSQERDELYDELVRTIAFGAQSVATSQFRTAIETNDFIGCNLDFDTLQPSGAAAAPGTPWGSDEIIYERTISQQVVGEFVVDPATGALLPLSEIIVTARTGGTEDDPENAWTAEVTHNRDPSEGAWI